VHPRAHRRSQDFLWRCTFSSKKFTTFLLVVAPNTQAKTAILITRTLQISSAQQKCPQKLDFLLYLGCTHNLRPKIFSPPWGCTCIQCWLAGVASPQAGYAYARGQECTYHRMEGKNWHFLLGGGAYANSFGCVEDGSVEWRIQWVHGMRGHRPFPRRPNACFFNWKCLLTGPQFTTNISTRSIIYDAWKIL